MISTRNNFILITPEISAKESVLFKLDEERFKIFVRVSWSQFGMLLNIIETDPVFTEKHSCKPMPVRKQLCIMLPDWDQNKRTWLRFSWGNVSNIYVFGNRLALQINSDNVTFVKCSKEEMCVDKLTSLQPNDNIVLTPGYCRIPKGRIYHDVILCLIYHNNRFRRSFNLKIK